MFLWVYHTRQAEKLGLVETSNFLCAEPNVTVDFNSLFTEMFRTSFRTSEIRCEVQKFTMKFDKHVCKQSFWLATR